MTGALQRPPEEARGTIRRIEPANVQAVARLMASVKPEWWDTEGAAAQLQDVALLARLVGWYLEEDGVPRGWILCAEFDGYSCLSIENLGYDDQGRFSVDCRLDPLLRLAEQHARTKGYRCLRYVVGSAGFSCHGRPIADYSEALRTLHAHGRSDYDAMTAFGFTPSGFLPHCYAENYHGILLTKPLL